MYNTKLLTVEDYDFFRELYEDFCNVAKTEYNFELEPLDYEGFLDAIAKKLIDCIVLYDNHEPAGFLVYTTAISEAVELNIIHCQKGDHYTDYAKELLLKFLHLTKDIRKSKIVCYPMLGLQDKLVNIVVKMGFRFIGTEVLRFKMHGTPSKDMFKRARVVSLPKGYQVVKWTPMYFEDGVKIIQEAFKNSSDALFDPRFKTESGCRDILNKVVKNVYAEFLPDATSVLLYESRPVGFSFMNITDGKIVNIPLVGINDEHQGKGLSTIMLKRSMEVILRMNGVTEINTTTETNNLQALGLYKNLGFIEDYSYPQAYLPII
ncbi:GNAT family N-acetyltransferase [bacterium]|nr:GNAT family N-acetyltransferase [bacterium]